jgi:predicted permease
MIDVFLVVLQSVLVLLIIGIIGFLVARRHFIPETFLKLLTMLVIDIALPCMIFASILSNFDPKEYPGWWQLPLWWFAFAAISFVLSFITSFLANKDTRSEFTINLFFQNGLFFPLVIISGVYGIDAPYTAQLYIFIILHPIMFFSTYHLFFKNNRNKTDWHNIINPIFIATILAIIVQLLGVKSYMPDFVHDILRILGGMALPLIMIILGSSLYLDFKQSGKKLYYKEIIKFLAIKNILFPLVFIALLFLIKPPFSISLLFFLQAAVPPITATPILTERAGGNKLISGQFVLASFLFSILTIPALFVLFSRLFPMP